MFLRVAQRSGWSDRLRRLLFVTLAIAAAFLPVAVGYVNRFSLPVSAAFGIYACFVSLLLELLATAVEQGRLLLARFKPWALPLCLILPYLAYAAGTGDFQWIALGRLLLVAGVPLLLYSALPVGNAARFNWQDLVVAIWLVAVVLGLQRVWNVPANLEFLGRMFVAAVGAICWTAVRPVPGLGWELRGSRETLLAAARNFLYFAVIAVPLGFALRFTAWNPRWHGWGQFGAGYLELFLFVAVLEELFFRGFLQNLLERSLQSRWVGQLISSVIFGLFHILHAPFPNWRYVVLASIAGWFYGAAYRSGGLLSSMLVHAAVDNLWRTLLTRS